MQINILQKKKNSVVFELKGEKHSFPALLCATLLKDKKVKIAVYDVGHPLTGQPKVYLETEGKNPKTAILDALEVIKKDVSSLKRGLAK